jgi:hypothetical protein
MDLRDANRAERLERLLWGAVLALYAGFLLAAGISRYGVVTEDAWIGFGVCRQILDGTTEGRQALVSSIWWPPVPSLLRLPFVWMSGVLTTGVALLAVGVIGAACVPLVVERALRRWGAGRSRYLFAVLAAADPDLVRWALSGSAAPAVVATALATLYGLAQWTRTRGTGALAYAALGSAVMVGMGAEAALWVVVALFLILVDSLVRPAAHGQRQAIVIMAAVPVLYAAGLWILMNWLIMGDGLYFLRSVRAGLTSDPDVGAFVLRHGVAAGLLCMVALVGVLKRDRGAAFAGAAGLTFGAVAMFLAVRGLLWDPSLAALALVPAAVMSAGYLVGTGTARSALAPLFVLAVAGMVALGWGGSATSSGFLAGRDERNMQWAQKLERHVLTQSRHAKVFVCGYDAFELAATAENRVFVPCLDFSLGAVRHDYHGHKLYLLIHRPKGRSEMDSIHWKYDKAYYVGIGETLYDSDWGHWRLFEIIEAPVREKTGKER